MSSSISSNMRSKAGDARPWIVYVGPIAFPEGDAGTRRVLGVASTLCTLGFDVTIAAGLNPAGHRGTIPGMTIAYEGLGEYERGWGPTRKLSSMLFGMGAKAVPWLDSMARQPAAVIIYGTSLPILLRVRKWCTSHQVPLLADVVEWYNGSHMVGGRLGPLHLSNEYAMRRAAHRCDGIIGISSFLCRHFGGRGTPVLQMPPTLDTNAMPCKEDPGADGGPVRLVYAGVPGKKDLLGNALAALAAADPEGRCFRLRLLGPDESKVRSLFPTYPRNAVDVLGRRSHAEVAMEVAQADFSILLRPDARYAHAGFPTKVAESMSCGTPVICNLTSDLAGHVQHGRTGIVCRDHSKEAFVDALQAVREMSLEQRMQMRREARRHARDAFDYRAYSPALQSFLTASGVPVPQA